MAGDLVKNLKKFRVINILVVITLLTTLLFSVLTLVSCKRSHDSSYSVFKWSNKLGVSSEGFLYEEEHVLCFYDFASGQSVVLCNRPDCQHQPYSWDTNPDPECNAVLPYRDTFTGLGMHNGYVYIFSQSSINKTTLYRQKPDGDGREILSEFNWGVDPFNDIVFRNNIAYFIGVQLIYDEEGTGDSDNQKSVVLSVDLQAGTVKELTDVKYDNLSRISALSITDDTLYYSYVYYDEGMDFMDDNAVENIPTFINHYILEIDIPTETEKQLLDLSEHNDTYVGVDDKYFYFLSGDKSKIYSVGRDDFSEKVLFEGKDIIAPYMLNNYLIIGQGDDFSTSYFCDLATGKTIEVNRPGREASPELIYNDWIFFGATLEDGTFTEVFMSIEDYLNGKTDYITIK